MKTQKKNTGKDSEDIFEEALNKNYGKNAFLHRLTDTAEASRGGKIKVKIRETPSDFILTLDGIMLYLEVKSSSNKTSFPFANFTTGQIRAMRRQAAAGGTYAVYIHNKLTDGWFSISGREVINLLDQGVKSIKWTELKPININKV